MEHAVRMARLSPERRFGKYCHFRQIVDSTNRLAKELAGQGAVEGTLIVADEQTQGKGRHSRIWHSPRGLGLWFSLILRPDMHPRSLKLLTFLAASSIVETFYREYGLKAMVKWPNDIMLGRRKAAGILAEVVSSRPGNPVVVLGVGINVNQLPIHFSSELRRSAVSLRMALGKYLPRFSLLDVLMQQMESDYQRALVEGFGFILRHWVDVSSVLGKEIRFETRGHSVLGWVKGFHANGDIVLLTPDGKERRFSDGHITEVSHAVGR